METGDIGLAITDTREWKCARCEKDRCTTLFGYMRVTGLGHVEAERNLCCDCLEWFIELRSGQVTLDES